MRYGSNGRAALPRGTPAIPLDGGGPYATSFIARSTLSSRTSRKNVGARASLLGPRTPRATRTRGATAARDLSAAEVVPRSEAPPRTATGGDGVATGRSGSVRAGSPIRAPVTLRVARAASGVGPT